MQMPALLTISHIITRVTCGAPKHTLRRDLQKMCPAKLYGSEMKSLD